MANELQQSRKIDGKGKTVRELLANRKYSIDYYQREYKWQKKQLLDLLEDLSQKFEENYEPTHERDAVMSLGLTIGCHFTVKHYLKRFIQPR
jgi:hypothetical protein